MKNTVIKKTVIFGLLAVMLATCAFALCACDKGGGDRFSSDVYFNVNKENVKIMGQGTKLLVNAVFVAALDEENTYLVFGKDGKMHFQIRTKAGLFENINTLLDTLSGPPFNMNLSREEIGKMLANFDIKGGVDSMVEPMFPGFRDKLKDGDLDGALKLIQRSLGFYLYGLDYENENIKEVLSYVGKNMALPADLLDKIPADTQLTLTFDNDYYIKDVVGSDGTTHKAIYITDIGTANPDTQPFGIFTVNTNSKGKMEIVLNIEFMAVRLGFVER